MSPHGSMSAVADVTAAPPASVILWLLVTRYWCAHAAVLHSLEL